MIAGGAASGMVDPSGNPPTSQTVSVVDQGTNTVDLVYDRPGSINNITFQTRAYNTNTLVPSSSDAAIVFNSGMITGPRLLGTGGGPQQTSFSTSGLFPFSSPYSVYAGTCDQNAPPSGAGARQRHGPAGRQRVPLAADPAPGAPAHGSLRGQRGPAGLCGPRGQGDRQGPRLQQPGADLHDELIGSAAEPRPPLWDVRGLWAGHRRIPTATQLCPHGDPPDHQGGRSACRTRPRGPSATSIWEQPRPRSRPDWGRHVPERPARLHLDRALGQHGRRSDRDQHRGDDHHGRPAQPGPDREEGGCESARQAA